MKLFVYLQKQYKVLGICPPKSEASTSLVQSLNWRNVLFFIFEAQFGLSAVTFLLSGAETIPQCADAFYTFATVFINSVNILAMIWNNANIFRFINELEKAVQDQTTMTDSENKIKKSMIPNDIAEKLENFTKMFYFVFAKLTLLGLAVPTIIITFYVYFTNDFDNDAFELPFLASIPFNWKTPTGYLFAYSSQIIGFCCILQAAFCLQSFIISVSFILMLLCQDVALEIHSLNDDARRNSNKIRGQIIKIIQFHTKVKQFAHDFVDINKVVFFSYILWSVMTICSTLLVIQMEISNGSNFLELVKPGFLCFWSFALVFMFCHFGESVTSEFDEIHAVLWDCEWYSFPKEVQRILPIIMISTQRPVIFSGMGNVVCTRETCKRVVNGGFSYFTVLARVK